MNRSVKLFVVLIITVFISSGCEYLPFSFSEKPAKKKQEVKPPAGAVVVARVNNMFITSEELDNYVESYNSQVEELEKIYQCVICKFWKEA